jgi:hypothetical protein
LKLEISRFVIVREPRNYINWPELITNEELVESIEENTTLSIQYAA